MIQYLLENYKDEFQSSLDLQNKSNFPKRNQKLGDEQIIEISIEYFYKYETKFHIDLDFKYSNDKLLLLKNNIVNKVLNYLDINCSDIFSYKYTKLDENNIYKIIIKELKEYLLSLTYSKSSAKLLG